MDFEDQPDVSDVSGRYQHLPPLSVSEMNALREDIRENGVRVAVELDSENRVLDGHHRLKICRELGIKNYPRFVRAGLTEEQKHEFALSINLNRRHLSRNQRRILVSELRALGWSTRRIGIAAGISPPTVLRDLAFPRVSNGTGDSLAEVTGSDGKIYPARRKPTTVLVRTDREQAVATEALQSLGKDGVPARLIDLRRLERLRRDQRSTERREAARAAGVPIPGGAEFRCCSIDDFSLEQSSVSLIVTDPPYTREAMDDGAYRDLGRLARNALTANGFLVAYAPTMFLPQAISDLGESGLSYWWMSVITFPRHPYQVRQRAVGSAFRPVLVFRQPEGEEMPGFTIDVLTGGGRAKENHRWEQATRETDALIEAFSSPGDLVVDPYCGSGTVGLDAQRLGRKFIGADVDSLAIEIAISRMSRTESCD